jgi:hypothetical protein
MTSPTSPTGKEPEYAMTQDDWEAFGLLMRVLRSIATRGIAATRRDASLAIAGFRRVES